VKVKVKKRLINLSVILFLSAYTNMFGMLRNVAFSPSNRGLVPFAVCLFHKGNMNVYKMPVKNAEGRIIYYRSLDDHKNKRALQALNEFNISLVKYITAMKDLRHEDLADSCRFAQWMQLDLKQLSKLLKGHYAEKLNESIKEIAALRDQVQNEINKIATLRLVFDVSRKIKDLS